MSLTLTSESIAPPAPFDWTDVQQSRSGGTPLLAPAAPALDDPNGALDGVEDDEPALSSYARCSDGNGTLSFLFFSQDDLDLARAKAICRSCGMQESCLSGAIERVEPYGVWGGKLVLEGVPVEFKRKRGRPPKNPKPILVVDEAPIPPHLVA